MLSTILIVLLILFLLGAFGTLPVWPHSRNWGYGPSGGLGLLGTIILAEQKGTGVDSRIDPRPLLRFQPSWPTRIV
jgi:hypothetical protein